MKFARNSQPHLDFDRSFIVSPKTFLSTPLFKPPLPQGVFPLPLFICKVNLRFGTAGPDDNDVVVEVESGGPATNFGSLQDSSNSKKMSNNHQMNLQRQRLFAPVYAKNHS